MAPSHQDWLLLAGICQEISHNRNWEAQQLNFVVGKIRVKCQTTFWLTSHIKFTQVNKCTPCFRDFQCQMPDNIMLSVIWHEIPPIFAYTSEEWTDVVSLLVTVLPDKYGEISCQIPERLFRHETPIIKNHKMRKFHVKCQKFSSDINQSTNLVNLVTLVIIILFASGVNKALALIGLCINSISKGWLQKHSSNF